MDFFSHSKPSLINDKTIKYINKLMQYGGQTEPAWHENLGNFYVNYLQPNIFAIIIFVLIIIFLFIKYVIKNDHDYKNKKNKKNKHRKDKNKSDNKKENVEQFGDNGLINELEPINKIVYEDINDENNDENIDEDDELSIEKLEDEYNEAKSEWNMSEQMLRDLYETRSSKACFDEMAKMVIGNN